MKIIKTSKPNLSLRKLSIEDARHYFELLEKNRDHLSQFGTMTEARYRSVKEVAESIIIPNPKKKRFAVLNGKQLVGLVSLVNKGNKRAEIGGWIGAQFVRKGYGTSALRALAAHAKRTGYTRVIATTYPQNIASQNMLLKIGFKPVRKLKRRHYFGFNV